MKVGVAAGPYFREFAPVKIKLPKGIDASPKGVLPVELGQPCDELLNGLKVIGVGEVVGVATARMGEGRRDVLMPMQIERREDEWFGTILLQRMEPNCTITVELVDEDLEGVNEILLRHVEDERKIEVKIGGGLFTAYQYSENFVRPFFHPVIGPMGKHLTRELWGDPSKGFDHVHHRSLYTAWGDINGVDVWSEQGGHGYMRHHCFGGCFSGSVYGRICAHTTWTDNAGNALMEQIACYQFYGLPESHRMIDVAIAFHAKHGDVRFGDTKEGGIISLRVYPTMTVVSGGRLENSYGAINEKDVWGKRAHWCDYSGPVDGVWIGVAIFDHPKNLRHPTYWHARDYGLMTANPFGLSEFLGKGYDGSYTLMNDQWLVFRYRIYAHIGDATVGRVREHYINYVAPPAVREI